MGDMHFRHELSYGTIIKDGRKGEWDAVLKIIHEKAKTCDVVVLLGDVLNSRHNHSSVIRRFVEFLRGFGDKEVHIIAGNHERYGTETALDFLKGVRNDGNNWWIWTEPQLAVLSGGDDDKTYPAFFIPYTTPHMMGGTTKEEAHDNIVKMFPKKDGRESFVFMHHGIKGSIWEGGTVDVDMFNEVTFSQSELEEHFDHAFGGHVHQPQRISDKTIVAGSILTTEVGEDSKSIWIYDTAKGLEEIELPVRGIYKHIWNGPSSLAHIPDHSIVKCVVTNKVYNLDDVREGLKRFDASIIVEQYPNERTKVHFEEGMLDLSLDNLLKIYSKEKGVDHSELSEAYSIVDSYDFNRTGSVVSENGNSNPA